MANVLGLAMKVTADASQLGASLTPVERALKKLGDEADKSANLFKAFATESSAAAQAQANVQQQFASLADSLRSGAITAQEYSERFKEIQQSARSTADAFAEGAALVEKNRTEEEKRAEAIARLNELLRVGAIDQGTFNAELAEATGANAAAAKADQERSQALARAAAITQANLSPLQKYDQITLELQGHLNAGRITQETFNAALAKATADFAKAETAARGYDEAVDGAGSGGTLAFNELSGILAVLPGPLGNIAGRFSGLASAGEGLGRVFSGGLSQGFASIGTSVAGLVNPFTAGLAAVTAFGAGATAVASSLVSLEDRVERLGRLSNQLGVSFEFVQTLEEAGNRADVSIEQLSGSFARLQNTLVSGGEDSKKAAAALSQLGVTVEQFGSLSEQQQIELIGQRLATIENPAQRSAAAIALFGRSGVQLLPFFNELDGAAQDIERLGSAVSDIDRSRLADFGAGIDALGVATRGIGQNLTLPFVGLGEGIAQGSAEFLGGINAIVGPIGDVLEPALSSLGAAFEVVGVTVGGIGRVIGAILAPVGDLAQAFGFVGDSFNAAFVDVVRYLVDAAVATTEWVVSWSPLGVIADNLGAFGEAIASVGNTVTSSLEPVVDMVQRISAVASEAFSQFSSVVQETFGRAITVVTSAVAAFAEFTGISSTISAFASSVASAFQGLLDGIQNVVSVVGGFIDRVVSFAEAWLGVERTVEAPLEPTLDLSQPLLAATQFNDEIGKAATAAADFGEAGFQAALSYQTALEDIAQLQAEGTYSTEEAKRAADQAKASFDQTVAVLEEEAAAQRQAAEAAEQAADKKIAAAQRAAEAAIQADQRRADAFIGAQGIGQEDASTKASQDLLAITRQIDEAETAIVQARASGDKAAEDAALRRLAILDQAEAAANEAVQFGFTTRDADAAIEEIRGKIDSVFTFDNFTIAPDAFKEFQAGIDELNQQLQDKVIDPETYREAAQTLVNGVKDAVTEAEKLQDLQANYAERVAEIDAERLDALSRVSQEPLRIEDIRTSGGISEFLRLATGREDPAIDEARKQTRELQRLRDEITKLGGQVEIVGAG